ncbi:hypothetical protein [Streptomyces hydrogenans]|uniref:Uncharacterized protein n=1 Tax=Streptomyces hydrogenans TaxID=1873719 RepID=A0ABQ3PM77_9ACTN|nr:hypothetical protein [Streptomyces hydrogenans]GHF96742.1 hypothetical protein GCM10018784_05220 [Streptomyces hydrogenans]GHI26131.1 hypothetical protein Shyd_75020 [Streptomyces hydrogenans]
MTTEVRHRDQAVPRVHYGAFFRDGPHRTPSPSTGEPLSTVTFMARTPAAGGEFRHHLPREGTYGALRADADADADAKGGKGGCRTAVPVDTTEAVRAAACPPRHRTAPHRAVRGAVDRRATA